MYAIYHQIDREKKQHEEKENERTVDVLVEELKQLEAKLLRRDSYSTITTQDTGIIIETAPDRKQLLPITWKLNGKLPIEISVPETRRKEKSVLLEEYNNVEAAGRANAQPPEEKDDALFFLQNSLFVDDDEELALIFDDNHEDEMNVQRTMGNHAPLELSLASSSASSESSFSESSYSESSFYAESQTTSCDSEGFVRFEAERITRFEI